MSKEIEPYDATKVSTYIWHCRKIGESWDDITLKVHSEYGVKLDQSELMGLYRTYRAHLAQMITPEERAMELVMELERLNALQESWWHPATNGDEKAAMIVLNTMKERNRIMGHGLPDATDANVTQNVLIIGDNKDEWMAALEHGRSGVVLPGPSGDDSEVDTTNEQEG